MVEYILKIAATGASLSSLCPWFKYYSKIDFTISPNLKDPYIKTWSLL